MISSQSQELSGDVLPENVSVAAKTIIDYAMGSLANQINSGAGLNNNAQNIESAFTNMASKLASARGGKTKRNKIVGSIKKTRRALNT
jgi:hypothetical protein